MTDVADRLRALAPLDPPGPQGRLRSASRLFAGLDASVLEAIEAELEWLSLPAGWTLFREGDSGDALYIVTNGCLDVVARDAAGTERLIGEILGGETVGEMALLSGEPRSATVIARRDSEFYRLDKPAYERIVERHPRAMLQVAAVVAQRLNRVTHGVGATRSVKTLALLPLTPSIPCAELARGFVQALDETGRRAQLVEPDSALQTTEWFSAIEAASDLVVFRAEPDASTWTKLCLRQADRIVLIAPAGSTPPAELPFALPSGAGRRVDLALFHHDGGLAAGPAADWLGVHQFDLVCHLRAGRRDDLARLARLATGQAAGLVLAGAGARGFAHIGVIRALREAGIPLDLVGGTSMGAIIAACVALEWDDREMRERLRQAFVLKNPVNDYVVPLIALVRGEKVARRLREHFGMVAIEDLWRPYFCISASLTTGRAVVHDRGTLCRALQASTAIPGLLPPVVERGEVLVDGGVVSNFPTDVMAALRRGPVIGVNVVNDRALTSLSAVIAAESPWRLFRTGRWRSPPIASILMRAGSMTSETQTELCRKRADLLLEPPLGSVDFLDWAALDRAAEIGYRYTMEQLASCELPLRAAR